MRHPGDLVMGLDCMHVGRPGVSLGRRHLRLCMHATAHRVEGMPCALPEEEQRNRLTPRNQRRKLQRKAKREGISVRGTTTRRTLICRMITLIFSKGENKEILHCVRGLKVTGWQKGES